MKILKICISALGITSLCSLYISCSRETPLLATTVSDFSNSATVQVFSATVKSARNFVYVDGNPVSGTGVSFGGVFPGTAYSIKLPAGSHTFLIKDTLPTTTQPALTFTQALNAGKSYTIFTYDTIPTIQQVTVVNNIVVPTDTSSRLRFANFVYNTTALPNVDVYSYRRGATPIFTNVPTLGVTDFIPYAAGLSDTLYVYATGTTSPLIVKQLVTSLTQTRSYTSVYSGSYKGTKAISTFANY